MATYLSEDIYLEPKKYVIPFCVPALKRKEPCTLDLEYAAVFALSELNRVKGGGFIMKQPEEKILFVAKVGYPLRIVPWSDFVLVFDGLNRLKYTVNFAALPEVKLFLEGLKRSSKNRETYSSFLGDHITDFQDAVPMKSVDLNGLMATPEFLKNINVSWRQATSSEDTSGNVALMSPFINESAISSEINELETLYFSLQKDAEDLNNCLNLLNKTTRHYVTELHGMMRAVKEQFNLKIEAEKQRIAPKIADLDEEYDARITSLTKNYESQRIPIRREIVKLETDKERTRERIERYRQEAKKQSENDKPAVEKRWKEKVSEEKKKLDELEGLLKQGIMGLKNLEERRSLETIKIKDELEARIKDVSKNVTELEASRDARLLGKKLEREQLENETKQIVDRIGKALKLREVDVAQFSQLGINRELDFSGNALFYIPFYVTCYQSGQTKRYSVLQPSVATAIGLSAKLKGVLSRARIKKLMVSRFETFSLLVDAIQVMVYQNAVFERELKELGAKMNILGSDSSLAIIKNGLGYLKKEGWLSDKEYEAINQKTQ